MPQQKRPTRVRYLVVAAATLMSLLLYLDRFCISFAEMYIQEDLGLSNTQVGWILSAFFWTYALGQVPAGWLTDRFGSRIMLTAYVLMWSLLTGLTGGAAAFAALLLIRLGFGFGQAGAYPTAASIVSKWVPFSRRGTASGIIAFGGRVGGFLALFASGHLIVWLTPYSVETALAPTDLLNSPRLCYELLDAQSAGLAPDQVLQRKVLDQFSDAGRVVVDQHGARYTAALEEERERLRAKGKNPKTALPQDVAPLPATDVSLLVTDLNQIIDLPGMFPPGSLQGVSVEKEANRLVVVEPSARSEKQSQRLNRLVLEALHRTSIKKLYVAGWRPMMFVYGSLGILVAGLIWWSCRSSPAEHPACNEAEVELISGVAGSPNQAGSGDDPPSRVPLKSLLTSTSMWLCCLTQWFTNIGWVFLMTWAPRYFSNVHKVSLEELTILVSIPPLVGWAGMLSGGAITDLAARQFGLRWGRALPISISRFLAMGAYLVCLWEPSAWIAVVLFSIVAFSTDLGTAPVWAFTQDIGGKNVGSVLGWGNMWGNLGAAVTPPILIWVVGDSQQWNNAFMVCAGAFCLAGLCALGINATIPITIDQPPKELKKA